MGVKGCGVRTAFNPPQREENGFSRELETIAHRANGIGVWKLRAEKPRYQHIAEKLENLQMVRRGLSIVWIDVKLQT